MLRNLKIGKKNKNQKLEEIKHKDVIESLGLNEDNFIDLCVLLGFYCDKVPGMGFETAYKKIKEHRSGENIFLQDTKYKNKKPINYDEACCILKNPNHIIHNDFKWGEELVIFLCNDKNFDETFVRNEIEKLKKLVEFPSNQRKRRASSNESSSKKSK